MQPLPLDVIRARVLTVKPRTTPSCCCICLKPYGTTHNGYGLCLNPKCHYEAEALGWINL